ncbi:MAG: M28 family peptidase, partial [Candidatus Hydrothermae bacterium]|nr:M28 family peptidase [Candidatus Hydrothermae bacterium]
MVRWLRWFWIVVWTGTLSAQGVDSTLQQLLQQVQSDTVASYILRLSAFGTRAYTSDSVQAARAWILQQFALRMDTTFEQVFFYNNTQQANVIARKMGSNPALPRLVVGAHYDDRPYTGPAPGADDNASGVALLLSLADLLSRVQLERTVELVAFAAEEPGFGGSTHYADRLQNLN